LIICVGGNYGAGKTTLCSNLFEHYKPKFCRFKLREFIPDWNKEEFWLGEFVRFADLFREQIQALKDLSGRGHILVDGHFPDQSRSLASLSGLSYSEVWGGIQDIDPWTPDLLITLQRPGFFHLLEQNKMDGYQGNQVVVENNGIVNKMVEEAIKEINLLLQE